MTTSWLASAPWTAVMTLATAETTCRHLISGNSNAAHWPALFQPCAPARHIMSPSACEPPTEGTITLRACGSSLTSCQNWTPWVGACGGGAGFLCCGQVGRPVVALESAKIIKVALCDPVLFWNPRRKIPRKPRLATGTDMPSVTEDGAVGDHLGERDERDEDSVAEVDSDGLDEELQSSDGGEHALGFCLNHLIHSTKGHRCYIAQKMRRQPRSRQLAQTLIGKMAQHQRTLLCPRWASSWVAPWIQLRPRSSIRAARNRARRCSGRSNSSRALARASCGRGREGPRPRLDSRGVGLN